MGRLQGSPSEDGLRFDGKPSLPRVHRQDPQGDRLPRHLRHCPWVRGYSQGCHLLHDIADKARQGCSLLQQRSRYYSV